MNTVMMSRKTSQKSEGLAGIYLELGRGRRSSAPPITNSQQFRHSAHRRWKSSPTDDVLSNVAIFFTARELCRSLSRVCRTWRRMTVCALRQVTRVDFKQRAVMLAPSFGTEISLSSTRSFLRTLRTRCPHLTSLSLNVNFSMVDIPDLLNVCGDSLTEPTLPSSYNLCANNVG
eukprot:744696_1